MNILSRSTLVLLFVLCGSAAYSQDDYYRLRSQGSIPTDFTRLSVEKYEQDKAQLDQNEKRSTRSAKNEFLLKSNYGVDEILRSGKVLFNDSISIYLNKIKDELLKNDPQLQREIKVYATKSSSVNAFATNNGIILVNLGLLARMENEAQLAYVLSHEIIHYIKKHNINEYVVNKEIQRGADEYQGMTSHEKELASCRYSQDAESEADLEGLELFNKSSYSNKTILNVFRVLEFSYLPYDNQEFSKTFFNTVNMKIPSGYFLDSLNAIKSDSSDDSKSSHPNPHKRKAAVNARMNSTDGKSEYVISQSEFLWCRDKSRMEICRLLLLNHRYEQAIYHTYLLLKEHPDSKYLKKVIAKSLYGLARYKAAEHFSEVHVSHWDVEGESHQVYYFFGKLSGEELGVIATSYLWRLRKQYPEDVELRMMSEDMLNTMVHEYYPDKNFFYATPKDTSIVLTTTSDSATRKSSLRYVKMREMLDNKEVERVDEFIRYAFVEFMNDKEFLESYETYSQHKKNNEFVSDEQIRMKRLAEKKERKEKRLIERKGYALGIDKVIVIDPFYLRINKRKRESNRLIFTEQKKLELNNQMLEASNLARVETVVISPVKMTPAEVEAMNDYALMEEWIYERLEHHEEIQGFVSPFHQEVNAMSKKYGTSNFAWSGVVWYSQNYQVTYNRILLFIYPPLLPIGIYKAIKPEHRTLTYTMLFDVNSGVEKMHYVNFVKSKESRSVTLSGFYYTFLQIKKPVRK